MGTNASRYSTLIIALCAVCTVTGCLGPKTLEEALKPRSGLSSAQATIRSSAGGAQTMYVKLEKSAPIATKLVIGNRWVLHDMKQNVVFMGSRGVPAVMKVSAKDRRAGQARSNAPDVDAYDKKAAVVGSEDIDGVKCSKIEATDTKDGGKATLWIGRNFGLLRRATRDGTTTNISYDQVNTVAAKEFQVPEGSKIIDLTGMQRGLRDLFGRRRSKGGGGSK